MNGTVDVAGTITGSISALGDVSGSLSKTGNVSGAVSTAPAGTKDYNELNNKPQIDGVTLQGNKTLPEFGLDVIENRQIKTIFDRVFKGGN